jgi:phosphoglycolate phosphatase
MDSTPQGLIRPQLVLIDVDGTLVDSVPDLAFCVDQMMQRLGQPAHGEDRVRNWVGNGVERLVRRALVGELDGEPDDELFARAYPIFLELYADNTCRRSTLYPGVQQALDWMRDQGYRLGCVTNKAEQFTLPLLESLGIRSYFQLVISGDSLPRKKPDPLPLLHAAGHFGAEPAQCLMLGDSISDVKAARAAGFQIFCMPYGYNHGADIRTANPDRVLRDMAQVSELLAPRA